jgi:chromosome segregation ATPase
MENNEMTKTPKEPYDPAEDSNLVTKIVGGALLAGGAIATGAAALNPPGMGNPFHPGSKQTLEEAATERGLPKPGSAEAQIKNEIARLKAETEDLRKVPKGLPEELQEARSEVEKLRDQTQGGKSR